MKERVLHLGGVRRHNACMRNSGSRGDRFARRVLSTCTGKVVKGTSSVCETGRMEPKRRNCVEGRPEGVSGCLASFYYLGTTSVDDYVIVL